MRMSKETQDKLQMSDAQADFDEFLQDPESERGKELGKKLKVKRGHDGGFSASLDGIHRASGSNNGIPNR